MASTTLFTCDFEGCTKAIDEHDVTQIHLCVTTHTCPTNSSMPTRTSSDSTCVMSTSTWSSPASS